MTSRTQVVQETLALIRYFTFAEQNCYSFYFVQYHSYLVEIVSTFQWIIEAITPQRIFYLFYIKFQSFFYSPL